MTKMYIPAYQIKAGYRELEGRIIDPQTFKSELYLWHSFKIGRDVFASPVEARAEAEKLRLARIASLTKSLAKLNSLSHAVLGL